MNYRVAIKEIIGFKKAFDKINSGIPRKLLGEIGEFYVLKELENLGLNPISKGGQGGYDIYLPKMDKKVEVKTSLLKNEGTFSDKTIKFWGWAVERRNQKKTHKFDYLVGVALDDDFRKPKFYVFSYKEAFSVKNVHIGRFNNIKKKIILFENRRTYKKAINLKPELVTKFERYINCYPRCFLNKWAKIKK